MGVLRLPRRTKRSRLFTYCIVMKVRTITVYRGVLFAARAIRTVGAYRRYLHAESFWVGVLFKTPPPAHPVRRRAKHKQPASRLFALELLLPLFYHPMVPAQHSLYS
eukprot:1933913-Pyramimonas_sp.AAC.2